MGNQEIERVSMRDESYQSTLGEIQRCNRLCYQINHTEPHTEESIRLIQELLPNKAESSHLTPPMQIDMGSNVRMGENVFINHCLTIMSKGGVEIEDNVMIGPNASLLTANHDFDDHMVLLCQKIRIEKNAWIGANVTILPGMMIGENAVVASGAVVTRDVEPNTVVGENPARLIKRLEPKGN